jgi:hypothetical protein
MIRTLLVIMAAAAVTLLAGIYMPFGIHIIVALVVIAAIGRYTLPSQRALRRRARGECVHCGYSLKARVNRRCPECGHEDRDMNSL